MQTAAHPEVSHYTYRVMWSAEDDEFVATCAEFPSLSWLASSQFEALQGLQDLLRDVIADMEEQGEQMPQPFAERSYSGKFNLRVGESLHRELAIQAAQDGMSLNQYVLRKLTARLLRSQATGPVVGTAFAPPVRQSSRR
ncbi:MAG TPA: toxin-antitoxin system HicB family antitoxin [Micromonosporaceae bacterium]